MTFSLIWLPSVLESAGLKVATVDGWETRGRGEMGPILGVVCHHTGTDSDANMPTLRMLRDGRPADGDVSALAGPLAQLGLGRDGTFYVIAAGRANHAGAGIWRGVTNGNANFIGIEAENTGRASDFPWPAVQLDAYQRGVAAILSHAGLPTEACCAHREYARPVGRKTDPVFDMHEFRVRVATIMSGGAPPALIPTAEPAGSQRKTLRRGMQDPLVGVVQRKLGIDGPDIFGPKTEAAVRALQRELDMVPDGIVGPRTWAELDKLPER